eukprot:964552-Pyramimonas_sp.AAC.1
MNNAEQRVSTKYISIHLPNDPPGCTIRCSRGGRPGTPAAQRGATHRPPAREGRVNFVDIAASKHCSLGTLLASGQTYQESY